MPRLPSLLSVLAMGAVPANAAAAPSDVEVTESTTTETSVLAGVGILGGDTMGGVGVSVLAMHRFDWFELGVDCQVAGFVAGVLGVGGMAGLHWGEDFSVRLMGSAGFHSYGGVGKGLLSSSDDPGVSGGTPYAGGRLLFGHALARRPGSRQRGFLGALVAVDNDLSRSTKTVTYTYVPWLHGGPEEVTEQRTIGQITLAAFFVAGVELDLTAY